MNSTININQPLPDAPYDFNPIINTGRCFLYLYSPYLGYANITQESNPLTQNWDALEVNLRHPVGHGLFVTSAYTWQHCLSEARGSAFIGPAVQDSYHPSNNYGTCGTNAFNVWTSSVIWSLPWFKGTGGWRRRPWEDGSFRTSQPFKAGLHLIPA